VQRLQTINSSRLITRQPHITRPRRGQCVQTGEIGRLPHVEEVRGFDGKRGKIASRNNASRRVVEESRRRGDAAPAPEEREECEAGQSGQRWGVSSRRRKRGRRRFGECVGRGIGGERQTRCRRIGSW